MILMIDKIKLQQIYNLTCVGFFRIPVNLYYIKKDNRKTTKYLIYIQTQDSLNKENRDKIQEIMRKLSEELKLLLDCEICILCVTEYHVKRLLKEKLIVPFSEYKIIENKDGGLID